MQTSTLYKVEYLRKGFKDIFTVFEDELGFLIAQKEYFLKKENKILYIIQHLDIDNLK